MELELREYKEYLTYEREHNLGKMPLKIDLLIIKKRPDIIIKNDIADFFLGNNILEYKSPGDDVNAGTFYKALAYACLYKAEAAGVADLFEADTTISIVREDKPAKLLDQLRQKYSVAKVKKGIYRIDDLIFPIQVLVTRELDKESHIWITSLTRSLNRKDAQGLLDNCAGLSSSEDRKNADSIVNVASEANIELFKKMIQEGDQMCEELKEMLAPEIVEFKIRLEKQNAELADKDAKLADTNAKLADRDAKLADNAAEIAKLRKLLAEAGIKES